MLHQHEVLNSRSRAFTLIELSAAGTLLAVGAAILFPGLRSTRQQDRLGGCLANLRAIGAASSAYAASDPNELYIPLPDLSVLPNSIGDFEWGGKAGQGSSNQPGDITYSYFGTRNFRGAAHRPLNTFLYKAGFTDWNPSDGNPQPGPGGLNFRADANLDLDVYRCPADTGYAGGGFLYTQTPSPQRNETAFRDEGLTAYDHYGTSYSAGMLYIVGGLQGGLVRSQSGYMASLSAIPAPQRTIAYREIPSRFIWRWGSWNSVCSVYESGTEGQFNTVPGWHGRDFEFSTGFFDGSVALVKMQGCLRPAPNLGASNYPAGQCSGAPEDWYYCTQCICFRGPDWQMDTLPAPPVPTLWSIGRSSGTTDRSGVQSVSVFP